MHYRSNKHGFEMREVTDEDYFEGLSLHRWSAAYGVLSLLVLGFAIFFALKHRLGYAALLWILSQCAGYYGGVLHRRAHEVLDA